MEKIIISAEAFGKLNALCKHMGLEPEAKAEGKAAEYLCGVIEHSSLFAEQADEVNSKADDALDSLYDRDVDSAIENLSEAAEIIKGLSDYANRLYDDLSNTLVALRDTTAPDSWAPIHSDSEVEAALENGFKLTNCMSLGYQDSKYALLFEEPGNENKLVCEPFIVAVGREQDTGYVRAYIESFMDMQDEDETEDEE